MSKLGNKEAVWVSDNDLGHMFDIQSKHVSIKRHENKWILDTGIKGVETTVFGTRREAIEAIVITGSLMLFIEDRRGDYRYLVKLNDLTLVSAVSCFDKDYKVKDDTFYKELIRIYDKKDLTKSEISKVVKTQVAVYPNKHNENYSVV